MTSILNISQITVSILLVICILLQQRGSGLGSSFGGSEGFFAAARGFQRKLSIATVVLGIAFIGLAVANLFF